MSAKKPTYVGACDLSITILNLNYFTGTVGEHHPTLLQLR